jgi:rhodanese-related sulfurtransferase
MRDLLVHGAPAFGLEGFVVVDCRHAYEFDGGRLPGEPVGLIGSAGRRALERPELAVRTSLCTCLCLS